MPVDTGHNHKVGIKCAVFYSENVPLGEKVANDHSSMSEQYNQLIVYVQGLDAVKVVFRDFVVRSVNANLAKRLFCCIIDAHQYSTYLFSV